MLEIIRQPISLLLFSFCLAFCAAIPLLVSHTLGETQAIVIDSALAVHFATGLLLGGYAACSSLARELHSGTASTILSKPVWRPLFFLAKFLGIVLVLVLFSLGASMVAVISARSVNNPFWVNKFSAVSTLLVIPLAYAIAAVINFKSQRPFASNAFAWLLILTGAAFVLNGFYSSEDGLISFASAYRLEIMPASFLVMTATIVLCSIAASLATRLDTIPTISICATIFLLGLMSDYLFGRFAGTSLISNLIYRIIPNWQHYWVVDALRHGVEIPISYIASTIVYALLYICGSLLLGINAFKRIEME